MQTQKAPKAVPTINLPLIDKILKRDAKAGRLIANVFLESGVNLKTEADCKNAGRCANGALLLAAGYDPRRLLADNFSINSPVVKKLLKEHYGLLPLHAEAIITTNDEVFCPPTKQTARYEEVMAILTFAEMMQREGVRFDDNTALEDAYREPEDDFEGDFEGGDEDVISPWAS